MSAAAACSYVLPLRWRDGSDRAELTHYLRKLACTCEQIVVVDGSDPEIFAANSAAWSEHALHVAPDADTACLMGKVSGVITGVRHAAHEHVVIADDDVRYEPASLRRLVVLLERYDLVWPQNFFEPLPWHARWDTARTLLNRAFGADFPGTLGVRRSRVLTMGGYDGNVMFENLELVRTVQAHGGRTIAPLDLYVRRRPPSAVHFWGQRTRQAYDDFAIPPRMTCWLAVVPALGFAILRRRPASTLLAAIGSALLAERGRRRCGGSDVFPASCSLLAPVWLLERGVCAWLAVLQRVRFGGVRYGGSVIATAAHSKRSLERRMRDEGVRQQRSTLPDREQRNGPLRRIRSATRMADLASIVAGAGQGWE